MAEITSIEGGRKPKGAMPQQSIIELLERLLGYAKTGHVQHLAAVWVDAEGTVGDGYVPGVHPDELFSVVGGLELLKATLVTQMMKGA